MSVSKIYCGSVDMRKTLRIGNAVTLVTLWLALRESVAIHITICNAINGYVFLEQAGSQELPR